MKGISHKTNTYKVTGRLEQSGDYIRLDYTNTDGGKKDFGTLLLENTSDGNLCGQFLLIDRSAVVLLMANISSLIMRDDSFALMLLVGDEPRDSIRN